NLGAEVHGSGVNFDNLETHDTRTLLPGVGCTIEPGIYLDEFGVRSEINLYMTPEGPEVTTAPQDEILTFEV
ncbi:MAG: aminopeptidase P family protein, partial [Acidobacteriota bacterium]